MNDPQPEGHMALHRTTKILSHARWRGSRVAARGARAATREALPYWLFCLRPPRRTRDILAAASLKNCSGSHPREQDMSDWLHGLPVLWMTILVFGFTYLITAGIYDVITVFAVGERARSLRNVTSPLRLKLHWTRGGSASS